MNYRNSKYNQIWYWESILQRKDVWSSMLGAPEESLKPVFINTSLIDQGRGLLDNNWACYPDLHSVLGFVKYIFLPTAFYYLNEDREELWTPVFSYDEFLDYVAGSNSEHKVRVRNFATEMDQLWDLDEREAMNALRCFCREFNEYWIRSRGVVLNLQVFFDAFEVGGYIKEVNWCEEILEEDAGLSFQQLDDFCRSFYQEAITKQLFLRFLNHNIGCLI